ncbi:hypothetical protein [Cytobacillus firmus]|uniref:hypothetical protein n=1 Tax=Cytobacillus firmus TaxID=1399 RepID=UPI0018CD3FB5|nr:hypothetical protein [Cytobacillus firmus]
MDMLLVFIAVFLWSGKRWYYAGFRKLSEGITREAIFTGCALKEGVKWQFLARNVAEAVTPPKSKKSEMLTWDSEQVKTFLEAAKSSVYYPVYLTTIFTGMRM